LLQPCRRVTEKPATTKKNHVKVVVNVRRNNKIETALLRLIIQTLRRKSSKPTSAPMTMWWIRKIQTVRQALSSDAELIPLLLQWVQLLLLLLLRLLLAPQELQSRVMRMIYLDDTLVF